MNDIQFIALIAALLFMLYMFIEARLNRLVSMDLEIEGLPDAFDGKTIFFISDIHRRRVSRRLTDQLGASPDFVVIGGDLTERGVPVSRVRQNLLLLTALGPTFFVWGNHDWYAGHEKVKRILENGRVTILDNVTQVIREGDQVINFTGVDDMTTEHDDLALALSYKNPGAPVLLFSHNPDIVRKLDRSMNIPYVISGHTHGGQINVFGYTIKEKGGVKALPFGTLIISNGYGTTTLPFRLAAKPDALLLRLVRKSR